MEDLELRFRLLKSEYEIPSSSDFELRELVRLEDQYKECNPEHIKTKQTLMSMILEIKKKLGI